VGPVKVGYDSKPGKSKIVDLSRYIDRKKRLVQSVTGQVSWNYGVGVCTINAPRAQGASGFLKKITPIKLQDVTIESTNEYAAVTVVPLDGQTLSASKNVLVQVGTIARPTSWSEREVTFQGDDGKETYSGKEVVDTGKMPWAITDAAITLTIANPNLTSATQLDINGNAKRKLKVNAATRTLKLVLPQDALYIVLGVK
jgi:hypothetical protein